MKCMYVSTLTRRRKYFLRIVHVAIKLNKWTYHPIVISVDTNSNDHAKEKEIKCAL